MPESTLESRLEAVEMSVIEIQKQLIDPATSLEPRGIHSIVGTMADCPEFDELMAHGKYIRQTGHIPPLDWKPGDPIPEPVE